MQIYKKVEKYFEPLWYIELLLFVFISSCWTLGCLSNSSIVSILCFTISQILIGWVGHSCDHNRNESLRLIGRFESALLGGFSTSWWGSKHNVHHMFTNIKKYDQDIQHEYKVYLFEFLFLKWRFDSFISAIAKRNPVLFPLSRYNQLESSSIMSAWPCVMRIFSTGQSASSLRAL